MAEQFAKKFGEIMKLSLLLMTCASGKCKEQKENAIKNEELVKRYNQYKLEQDKAKKLKLLGEINDNAIMYELNTCVIKNCNTLVKNLMKTLKSILSIVPKTSPRYEKMHAVINEMEILIKKKKLTETEYKAHINNINKVLATLT